MRIYDDFFSGPEAQRAFARRHVIDAAHLSVVAQPVAFAEPVSDFDTQR